MKLNFLTYYIIAGFLSFSCNTNHNFSQNGFISLDNSKIYFTQQGDGEPLFFVHAGFQDHKMWDHQVSFFLKQNYKVITIDLPGHGLTETADTGYFVKDFILACMDSLKISKASFIGLSLGGSTVIDFALAYPGKVNKLVLAASLAVGYDKKYPVDSLTTNYFSEFTNALSKDDYPEAAEIFTRYWCDGIRDKIQVNENVRKYVYQTTLASVKNQSWKKWAKFYEPNAIGRLSELKMPALLIYGDKDLPIIVNAAKVLAQLMPNVKTVELKNVAHMLNMEAPAEFNTAMLNFLKS